MNRKKVIGCFLFLFISLIPTSSFTESDSGKVLAIKVNGVINPVSSEFISKSIKKADAMNAEALVIELDTPGGLDTSMRLIVKDITASSVPVVVFVSPSGARAASAGTFIVLASHVAAMAPGTNIGAAHPVSVGGKMDETSSAKATNDSAAYIKSLAEKSGRNPQWAEDAVRKSVSATEREALDQNVIDIISSNLKTLLNDIDGRKIKTSAGEITISTKNAKVVSEETGFRHKILNFISDPSVAYMLMLLGFYGIFFELTNPGTIFPGVAGAIFLILAFYSFQTLPVNYAGLLFIVLAIILFVLEVKVISHGLLTIGGIISMVFGSLMLFESPEPFFKLSIAIILPSVIVTALFFTLTFRLAYKAYKRKPVTGSEGMIGAEGKAIADFDNEGGMVSVHGELWSAYSDQLIIKGDHIIITDVTDLKLKVRKKEVK